MATGDVTGAKRPRYQANERFDSGDADAASRAPRDHGQASQRALLTTPRASAGAVMPGLIINGFSLTLNPNNPTDGLVQINTELGVAIDANGLYIVKPTGITINVTIPAGSWQIYVYYQETEADTAQRRFLTVTSPFTEYPAAMATSFQSAYGTYVRSGNNTNTVKDDVINGVTTPLVCIGIVTNNGTGAIACAGYNAITAPNGSDITNRLSTAVAPATAPTNNTRNGSLQTIHDVLTAALYTVGQTAWKGSDFLTPAAGNNYGAYNIPAGGADKAFRQALGWVTIGNGTTIVGDFNTANYGNANLLLTAALASLPATGGTILLKRGVALSGFAGATVALPAGKTVEIRGDHSYLPSTPQLTFASAEGLVCSTTGHLTLRELNIQHVDTAVTVTNTAGSGGFYATRCVFTKPSGTDTGAALQGVNVDNLTLEDVTFKTTISGNGTLTAMALRITGVGQGLKLSRVYHSVLGNRLCSLSVADVRDFNISDYAVRDDGAALTGVLAPNVIQLDSTDATVTKRFIRDLQVIGTFFVGLDTGTTPNVLVERMQTVDNSLAIATDTAPAVGRVVYKDCTFKSGVTDGGFVYVTNTVTGVDGVDFLHCDFIRTGGSTTIEAVNVLAASTTTLKRLQVSDCTFTGFACAGQASQIINSAVAGVLGTITSVTVERCTFQNFQNIAYSGGAGASALINLSASRMGTVSVRGCTTRSIMDGTSGNARDQAFLVRTTGPTASNSIWQLTISGNQIGTDGALDDQCGLLYHTEARLEGLAITDNNVRIHWDTAANKAKWVTGSLVCILSTTTTLGGHHTLAIDHNRFSIVNVSNTDYTKDAVFVDNTGTANIFNFSIQGNVFLSDSSSKKFDYATAFGINIPSYTTFRFVLAGNSATSGDPSLLPDWIRFRFTGSVAAPQLVWNALTPGVGVGITGSPGIFSAV